MVFSPTETYSVFVGKISKLGLAILNYCKWTSNSIHLISTPTNAHIWIFYIKAFKIAPY